jgi:SpoVK/Ycf46/Vps4 family AAA+-type ATPase
MAAFANSSEHLLAELGRLELMLQRQVLWLRAAHLLTEDEYRGLYIPDVQVDALLGGKIRLGEQPAADATTEASRSLTALIEHVQAENDAMIQASRAAGVRLPLVTLAETFSLTRFEIDVLLLCVAPELELGYETLYAYVQNDITRKHPTVDLALRLLCPTLEDRLACAAYFDPQAALLGHHLIRLCDDPQDREPALPARFMKVDQRIVDYLLERGTLDERLAGFTRVAISTRALADLALPPDLVAQLEAIVRRYASGRLDKPRGVFFFYGPYGVGKQAAAESICAALGAPLLAVDLSAALAGGTPPPTLLALLRREAVLRGAGVYLAHGEALLGAQQELAHAARLADALQGFPGPLFIGSETDWQPEVGAAHWLSFEFPMPAFQLRVQIWQQALGNSSDQLNGNGAVADLASKFRLSGEQIRDAVRYAADLAALRPNGAVGITLDDLHAAARAQSSQGLRHLAQKVEPIHTWADIVLPPRASQQLQEVYASVKYRHVVYSRWGFDRKLALGKGLNVLFAGASGTGKTMAAGILAAELKLDLYKIDLPSVVSKYIGETEKNLDRIFNAAGASNAILFFDEADALFGKRSEVKDAHDRYANIEVAYLLQKMDEYDGIVILATNLRKNLDEAFARRMHHTVEFPFPDAVYRERIWEQIFPPEAPLAGDIDLRFMAQQFELSGGSIRNIALAAAFMAAESQGAIAMECLIVATAREIQKMGKLPSKAAFRQYYELIREDDVRQVGA